MHTPPNFLPRPAHPLQVLLKLIQPYTRVRIPFISQRLNIPEKDVEALLVTLILDNRVQGHIDQVRSLQPSCLQGPLQCA